MGPRDSYDVIVIGGGPAGLAAALWLARYRLRVRLIDRGDPRNQPTWAVHGYLGLEEVAPAELRRIGRQQAAAAGAEIEGAVVTEVTGAIDDFRVRTADGAVVRSRRVLFATGLRDIKPEIPGFEAFYGRSIWHCADCDGPQAVGCRIGVIGWGRKIAALCMKMLTWTDDIVVLTHGHEPDLPPAARRSLARFGIEVRTDCLIRIEGEAGRVREVVFEDGAREACDGLYFSIASGPGSSLPQELGCASDDDGILETDADGQTTVPGAYAAGDNTRGAKLAMRAAAEGTRAAIGIFGSLLPRERRV